MKQKLKQFFTKRNKLLLIALVVLIILLVLINSAKTKVMTDSQVISNISSLTNVPDPTQDPPGIFRIEDPTQMPAFFAGSKKGDIVVLFYKSARAIIYSPSDNRIINQGPIVNDEITKPKAIVLPTETSVSKSTSTTSGQTEE